MTEQEYDVFNENVGRHGKEVTKVDVDVRIDGSSGRVKFRRERGEWSIWRFTPLDGGAITRQKVSLGETFGSTSNTVFADFEETMGLIAAAVEYVEDVYDVDIGRSIWLTKYR